MFPLVFLSNTDLKGNVPKSVKESWAVSVKDKVTFKVTFDFYQLS